MKRFSFSLKLSLSLPLWRYPLGPPLNQLLWTISLLGQWSTSSSNRGIAHFFIATRNTIKGAGEKEQTNKRTIRLGLTQSAREEICNIAFPMCIRRLTRAWISSDISTKLLGMPTYLVRSFVTALYSLTCRLIPSAFRCRLATRVNLHQLSSLSSFVQLLLAFPYPLPVTSRSRAQAFVWFRAKTEKWIVCLADHLVLHHVQVFSCKISLVRRLKHS